MSISEKVDLFIQSQFADASSSIFRDLSLNFKKIMEEGPLDEQERFLNLLAIATTLENKPMMNFAEAELQILGLSAEHIQEAKESAAILGMLNVYYKFKGFLGPEVAENYARTGLRMQSLAKPINGKERFEQMAFSISVVNGCHSCVASHEKALTLIGVSVDKIHDMARLAAVSKGLTSLKKGNQ